MPPHLTPRRQNTVGGSESSRTRYRGRLLREQKMKKQTTSTQENGKIGKRAQDRHGKNSVQRGMIITRDVIARNSVNKGSLKKFQSDPKLFSTDTQTPPDREDEKISWNVKCACSKTLNLNVTGFIEVKTSPGTMSEIGVRISNLEPLLPEIVKRIIIGEERGIRLNCCDEEKKEKSAMNQSSEETKIQSAEGDACQQRIPTWVSGPERWTADLGTDDYESRQFTTGPLNDKAAYSCLKILVNECENYTGILDSETCSRNTYHCYFGNEQSVRLPSDSGGIFNAQAGSAVAFGDWEGSYYIPTSVEQPLSEWSASTEFGNGDTENQTEEHRRMAPSSFATNGDAFFIFDS